MRIPVLPEIAKTRCVDCKKRRKLSDLTNQCKVMNNVEIPVKEMWGNYFCGHFDPVYNWGKFLRDCWEGAITLLCSYMMFSSVHSFCRGWLWFGILDLVLVFVHMNTFRMAKNGRKRFEDI